MLELSEHGIVLIVEDSNCLQAKVYLQKEVLFTAFSVPQSVLRRCEDEKEKDI